MPSLFEAGENKFVMQQPKQRRHEKKEKKMETKMKKGLIKNKPNKQETETLLRVHGGLDVALRIEEWKSGQAHKNKLTGNVA